MTKETISFVTRLLLLTAILLAVHLYILSQFFTGHLYFPIWTIYAFNAVLVFIVYSFLRFKASQGGNKMYQLFL